MQPNIPIPFGDWRPDLALIDSQFAAIAENVYAGANSYLPFPSLSPFTSEVLPGKCVGLTFGRTATGDWVMYAGTPTHLYKWSGAVWTDVSRTVGGNYNVAQGDRWTFTQFGDWLIACHIGDDPQKIGVTSGTNFVPLGGSPPKATSVWVVGDFVVLAGLVGNRRVIQWSSINNLDEWIIGTNLGDMQEMPDGGPVVGVSGGEVGFVLQDRTIRTMQFLPSDVTTIFTFSRVEREKGAMAKYGFCFTRGVLFVLAEDGFYGLGAPDPAIGNDRINHWFMDNSDPNRRNETLAFYDPGHTRVMWAFYNNAGSQVYDRILIYDWNLARWTYSTEAAQMYATLASVSVNLDTNIVGDPLDPPLDSTAPSLDSPQYMGGRPLIAGIDVNGKLGFLNGPNLAATVETGEAHLSKALRTFVSSAYPLIDAISPGVAPGVTIAVGERERLQEPQTMGNPQPLESTGSAAVYSSSRLHRFRMFVPRAAVWTHAEAVQVEAQPDGEGY